MLYGSNIRRNTSFKFPVQGRSKQEAELEERDDKRGVNVKKGNVTFFNLQVFSNLGKVKKKMLNPLIH